MNLFSDMILCSWVLKLTASTLPCGGHWTLQLQIELASTGGSVVQASGGRRAGRRWSDVAVSGVFVRTVARRGHQRPAGRRRRPAPRSSRWRTSVDAGVRRHSRSEAEPHPALHLRLSEPVTYRRHRDEERRHATATVMLTCVCALRHINQCRDRT